MSTAQDHPKPDRRQTSTVSWVALLVAALLVVWQVVFALTIDDTAPGSQEVYTSISLFVTLVLAVGAIVLGLVALAQRRVPQWPAVVALAAGGQAFLVAVASWLAQLMTSVG